MLTSFLAKLCWPLLFIVAQILCRRAETEQLYAKLQDSLDDLLSPTSRKTDIMSSVEDQRIDSGHKGLLQRKSTYNLTENFDVKNPESIAMSRQSSTQSQKSSASAASVAWTKDYMDSQHPLGQPSNFGTVVPGVYRSSYPQEADYPFIQKLGLKTIM